MLNFNYISLCEQAWFCFELRRTSAVTAVLVVLHHRVNLGRIACAGGEVCYRGLFYWLAQAICLPLWHGFLPMHCCPGIIHSVCITIISWIMSLLFVAGVTAQIRLKILPNLSAYSKVLLDYNCLYFLGCYCTGWVLVIFSFIRFVSIELSQASVWSSLVGQFCLSFLSWFISLLLMNPPNGFAPCDL